MSILGSIGLVVGIVVFIIVIFKLLIEGFLWLMDMVTDEIPPPYDGPVMH